MLYYDIQEDINNYPEAVVIVCIGGRNTGKTYGALNFVYTTNSKFVFIKRTNDDVKLLCAGNDDSKGYGVDLSPFKSLNRDKGWNVNAYSIFKGLGGFWESDGEGERSGPPIGYIVSLNITQKVKGFDLSECDYMIFDEFIPQQWERVNRKEGTAVMDLYKTISRDREIRGRDALKLICLANATTISNPLMQELEIVDIVADMKASGESVLYIEDRCILIHILDDNTEFREKEKESKIYKVMAGTNWADMALNNEFANNDFTSVNKRSLDKYQPVCRIQFKNNFYYVYRRDNNYYMCCSRHNGKETYNLNLENDQKLFFSNRDFEFREACIEGRMQFQSYTMYDLIVNYKTYFKI